MSRTAPRQKSLLQNTSVIVVLVEAAVLTVLGLITINVLSNEIDNALRARARLPGLLMSRQLLRYESVADKAVMTSLAGDEFLDGMVVAADGHIYFAANPEFVGSDLDAVGGELSGSLLELLPEADDNGTVVQSPSGALLCITPIRAFQGAEPFFFSVIAIGTKSSDRIKTRMVWGFLAASIICILLTSMGLLYFFHRGVVKPLAALEKSANLLAAGDLDEPIDTARRDEIGSLARRFAAMRDAIRHKVRELEDANRQLLELDKLKSHFLSSVSHELRTPLTSLLGFASLTRKHFTRHFAPLAGQDAGLERRSRQIVDNLEVIEVEGARLTRLINDVLDLNRIESGRRVWRNKRVRPQDVLDNALRSTAMLFDLKPEIDLEKDIAPDLPEVVVDPDALQQVLVNLLHNAANYTQAGSVHVDVKTVATPGGQHGAAHTIGQTIGQTMGQPMDQKMVQFTIQDTGPGIREEDLGKLFQKFTQLYAHGEGYSDTIAPGVRGTGLGLAICKEIVTHYGGDIWVESAYGDGSAFHFTLPAAPPLPAADEDN